VTTARTTFSTKRTDMNVLNAELDILIYWMTERDRVRACKEAREPKPWTADPLLRDYRWCNVRRMDDRVSRWLIENWYGDPDDPDYQLLDAIFARLINWPDALAEIADDRHPDSARGILAARAARGEKVFTGAYVVPGVLGRSKVDSVCDLVEAVICKTNDVLNRGTMQKTWQALMGFDGLGSFLAGQIVADLAQLGMGMEWPDRDHWAPIGPGSARGINRLSGRPKDQAMRQTEFERLLPVLITVLNPRVQALWNDRGLVAMDIQNCLCEFDKYRRLTLGEGKVRARYDGEAPANTQQQAMFS
jgi:hypothetical protein